jgi:Uncharacterised protein family (UPF0014)
LLERGAYYGCPECYYDRFQQKLVLEPEYSGDAGKTVGVCAKKTAPVAALPAHWAPNDMLIYAGNEFPASYQGGRLRQVETGLALCAEPAATVAPYVQSAVYANLVPRLDMLRSLGLVWMPGVMAGMVVSGASRIYAGIYQFVIVAMILAASGITGLLAILLMRRRVFSPAAQLILRR